MKRLATLVTAAALALSLAACGSGSSGGATMSKAPAADGGTSGQSSDFPKKNITLVVPYGAGGGIDISCRAVVEGGNKELLNGKSIVIECREGGGGVVGTTYVTTLPADGYTLVPITVSTITKPMLSDEVTYTYEDFIPLAQYSTEYEIIVVPVDSPFNTVEDLVKYAKENEVVVSTSGHSTFHHQVPLIFANGEGLKFTYLHNSASNEQLSQLMGNHCDVAFMAAGEGAGAIQDGTVKCLGIMAEERLESLPDVPTLKEQGFDYVEGAFRGIGCLKGTPDDAVQVLRAFFDDALTGEACKENFDNTGNTLVYANGDDFQALLDDFATNIVDVIPLLKEGT